jgi:hypothetical protein
MLSASLRVQFFQKREFRNKQKEGGEQKTRKEKSRREERRGEERRGGSGKGVGAWVRPVKYNFVSVFALLRTRSIAFAFRQ